MEIVDPIVWKTKTVKFDLLRPNPDNPRVITAAQVKKLKESLAQDGYRTRLVVDTEYLILGGNQRYSVFAELGVDELEVLMPSRVLSQDEKDRIVFRDNHSNGTWDMEMLANNYDLEFLREMGLHEVQSIPPIEDEEEKQQGKTKVCCPKCGEVFPAKGNKVT